MTGNPLHDATRLGSAPAAEEASERDRALRRSLLTPVSAMSFWLAIALPALYLPLLLSGLSSVSDLAVFLGLFGLHVVALVGGRSYRQE